MADALPVPTRATWVVRIPSLRTDPVELFLTMVSATALCLPLTMERVSAQLDQYAACLVRRALLRPNSAQTEGKCHSVSDCRLHVWGYLANGAQTTPHSVIRACSELLCQLRPHHSQLVIRSTGSATATTSTRSGCPAKMGCVPRVSGAFSTPCEDEPPQNHHVPTEFRAP